MELPSRWHRHIRIIVVVVEGKVPGGEAQGHD